MFVQPIFNQIGLTSSFCNNSFFLRSMALLSKAKVGKNYVLEKLASKVSKKV